MILGIDVGGTNVRFGIVDGMKIIRSERLSTNEAFGDAVLDFAESVQSFIGKCGIMPEAISIGLPSILDKTKRRVISTANISFMQDIPLADILEERVGIPVFLNHDVKNLLEFDIEYFSLPTKDSTIIAFYIGTGFGNSVCIDGKYLSGKNGGAGEVAHMPFPGAKAKCGCGNYGCVETVAAGRRLVEIIDEYYPGESFQDIFTKHSSDGVIKEFIANMAVPIAAEISIFDPDQIVLGGGVIQTAGFPKEMLERQIYEYARKPLPAEKLEYRYTPEEPLSGVIGAAIYAAKQLKK